MSKRKEGFTLIEMLVVIAIIAVLVSVVIPVIGNSTDQAKAATDAANLRTVLGELNVHVVNGDKTVTEIINSCTNPTSKMDPDATLHAVFDAPGFIEVFYVNGSTFYSLDYLAECATNGKDSADSNFGTAKPLVQGTWYEAGVGQVNP